MKKYSWIKNVLQWILFCLSTSLFDDVCIIPDRFKHVVIDGAMMFMMRFRSNEQSAAMHQNNFEDGIKSMRRVLMDDALSIRSTVIGKARTSSFNDGA